MNNFIVGQEVKIKPGSYCLSSQRAVSSFEWPGLEEDKVLYILEIDKYLENSILIDKGCNERIFTSLKNLDCICERCALREDDICNECFIALKEFNEKYNGSWSKLFNDDKE